MVQGPHPALITFEPIGVVRSPFVDKKDAPRQPAASSAKGTIELRHDRDLEDALAGIEAWSHLWVVYVFDRAGGYRPKVQPPRAADKRGVLATRSPHRPNPIGLSLVRLLATRGLSLEIEGVDMLDGTPVLDLKPYVEYTDSAGASTSGWLGADPVAPYAVVFSDDARAHLATLFAHGVDLEHAIASALALGPTPHAYRRIRRDGETSVLAVKAFRARFVERPGRALEVVDIFSGHSARDLATSDDPSLVAHRALESARGRR